MGRGVESERGERLCEGGMNPAVEFRPRADRRRWESGHKAVGQLVVMHDRATPGCPADRDQAPTLRMRVTRPQRLKVTQGERGLRPMVKPQHRRSAGIDRLQEHLIDGHVECGPIGTGQQQGCGFRHRPQAPSEASAYGPRSRHRDG